MKYKINEPCLKGNEKKYLNEMIDSGWISVEGPFVKRFEEAFKNHVGREYAIAVNNGTAAVHTALAALGVEPGDGVIVPGYTTKSCASPVLALGGEPIIIDVEKDTFGLDADLVELYLMGGSLKPKVLMIVSMYGFIPRDFEKLLKLAKKHRLKVLCDMSQAHCSYYKEKNIGSYGDIAVFSCRSEKMIGVGEGGVVVTDSKRLYNKAKVFANRGIPTKKRGWMENFDYSGYGFNYRMCEPSAAIGVAQIEWIDEFGWYKYWIGFHYRLLLQATMRQGIICFQIKTPESYSTPWLNAFVLPNHSKKQIEEIGIKLMKKGIQVRPGFYPLGRMKGLRQYAFGPQTVSNYLYKHTIVLPSSIYLTEDNIKEICKKFKGLL